MYESIQNYPLELPSTQHKIAYRVDPKSLLSSYQAHLQPRGQRAAEQDRSRTEQDRARTEQDRAGGRGTTKRVLGEVNVEGECYTLVDSVSCVISGLLVSWKHHCIQWRLFARKLSIGQQKKFNFCTNMLAFHFMDVRQ
jgi:hypothetical protein